MALGNEIAGEKGHAEESTGLMCEWDAKAGRKVDE